MPPTSSHSAAKAISNIGIDREDAPIDVNKTGAHHIMRGIAMIMQNIYRRALKYRLI